MKSGWIFFNQSRITRGDWTLIPEMLPLTKYFRTPFQYNFWAIWKTNKKTKFLYKVKTVVQNVNILTKVKNKGFQGFPLQYLSVTSPARQQRGPKCSNLELTVPEMIDLGPHMAAGALAVCTHSCGCAVSPWAHTAVEAGNKGQARSVQVHRWRG